MGKNTKNCSLGSFLDWILPDSSFDHSQGGVFINLKRVNFLFGVFSSKGVLDFRVILFNFFLDRKKGTN